MSGLGSNGDSTSNRRRFLKTAGSLALVGSVAGCTGGDGGSGSDGGDGSSGSDGGDGGSGGDGGDGGSSGTTENPAADYPSGDISLVVPYATGGGFDAYARLLAPYLEEELGTTVNVRNVTGGGGVVGATEVWNAEPDGHTLMIWAPTEAAYKQIGLDVDFEMNEFSHVGYVTQDPNALTLMKSAGISSWDEFVDSVPDLNFVTQGKGSSAHMLTVLLGGVTGEFSVDAPNFVHYSGTGAALGGLEKGEGNAFTVGTSSSAVKVTQALEADMFTVFASPDHSISDYMQANDVDVMNYSTELGVDNMQTYNDLTVFRRYLTGPPGVPEAIQQKQIDAFDAVISNEQLLQEGDEAARPFINPAASAERVSDVLQTTYDSLNQAPYKGIIQDAFSG